MYKHSEIIEKLTLKQKIALITDITALSDKKYARLGLPSFKVGRVEELFSGFGLTLQELARSYDTELIERLTFELVLKAENRADLYICPSPKPYFNGARAEALSEDWYLSGELTAAICRGLAKAGARSAVDGFWLAPEEIVCLDRQPEPRAIREAVVAPFSAVLECGACDGVVVSSAKLTGAYEKINAHLLTDVIKKILPEGKKKLCTARTVDETLLAISSGCIMMGGIAAAVENAYAKYLTMSEAVERGQYTAYALEESLSIAEAISDEMIDTALDALIDFAFLCNERGEAASEAETEALLSLAAERSSVLLKNENKLLPIKEGSRIAIIGDCASASAEGGMLPSLAKALGSSVIGIAGGFDLSDPRNESYAEEAVKLVSEADVAVVFFSENDPSGGFDRTLSAGQMALADKLLPFKDKLVAVVSCSDSVDMRFDKSFGAILLSGIEGSYRAGAVSRLLLGGASPSGKLTKTFYYNPDEYFNELRLHKEKGHNKVGVFMDYRHYGISEDIKYPFGFGLSYSEFEYSDMRVDGDEVYFTLTNTGEYPAAEIAEIYVGRECSSLIRPIRELKGFIRTELGVGEKRAVRAKIGSLLVFDAKTKNLLVENGEYKMYASSSLYNPRLTVSQVREGWRFPQSGEAISDYLQTETNITDKKYYLEARTVNMNVLKRTRLISILSIAAGAALTVLAVVLGILSSAALGVLLGVLALGAICYGVYSITRWVKQKHFYLDEQTETMPELFADAEAVTVSSVRELFNEEFEDKSDTAVSEDNVDTEIVRIFRDVTSDDFLSLGDYLAERGILIDKEAAAAVVASLAAGRLIMASSHTERDVSLIAAGLTEFFDTSLTDVTVDDSYPAEEKLLKRLDGETGLCQSKFAEALKEAAKEPDKMHFILIKGLTEANIGEQLTPYIRYFGNPSSSFDITTHDGLETYTVSGNVWFIVKCDEINIDAIPAYLNEAAVHLAPFDVSVKARAEDTSNAEEIACPSFISFVKKTRSAMGEHEDIWKRLDGVEAYVSARSPYSMGNRLWAQIESYLSVFMSQGFELNVALDYTLSTVVLPTFASLIRGKLADEDRTLYEETERAFGEDNTEICKKMFNRD